MLTKYFILLAFVATMTSAQTFTNPLFPGADPSVIYVDGSYYYVQSGCIDPNGGKSQGNICIRTSPTLEDLGTAPSAIVWRAPLSGPNSADIWAPQIEYLNGSWYIYYAADSHPGTNDHKLFALVPRNPEKIMGEWAEASTGSASGNLPINWKSSWGIDPDVFRASDGKFYLTYSCRQSNDTTQSGYNHQSICLSAMSDPLHTQGQTVALSTPTQAWETRGFPTQEGPFGFTHDGIDYILFSGSFSGTSDQYSEGLLMNNHPPQPNGEGNALLNPASWIKEGPVFDGHHASYGTASTVLVNSPDGTELWNVYHGTDCLTGCVVTNGKTWKDRSIRAQKAGWSPAGALVLGYPVDIQDTDSGEGQPVPLPVPSTQRTGTTLIPAWGAAFGDAAEGDLTNGTVIGNWSPSGPTSIVSTGLDPGRFNQNFFGSNPNLQDYVLSTDVQLVATGAGDSYPKYGVYGAYVDHNNNYLAMVDVTACSQPGCLATNAVLNGKEQGWKNCDLPSGFNPNAANLLVVEVTKGTFHVSLNGSPLVGACQDRQFVFTAGQAQDHGSNGQVGVVVENTKAQYTNFNVSYGVPQDSNTNGQQYAFRNQASHMNLDNACDGCSAQPVENEPVIQRPTAAPYPSTTSPSQLWTLKKQSNEYFTIVSSASSLCLDNGEGSAALRQTACNGAASQNWRLVPMGDSTFLIQNQASSMVVTSSDAQQGSQIQLTTITGSPSQKWRLVIP